MATEVRVDKTLNDRGEPRFRYTLIDNGEPRGEPSGFDYDSMADAEAAGLKAADKETKADDDKAPAKTTAKKATAKR